jgi:hypothetical protein
MAVAEHTDEVVTRLVAEQARKHLELKQQVAAAEQLHNRAREKYHAAVVESEKIRASAIRGARLAWSSAVNAATQTYDRAHPDLRPSLFAQFDAAIKAADKTRDDAIAKAQADCQQAVSYAAAICRQSGYTGSL